jgi:hypothetical protein
MKKLATFVFALLLGASLSFAQAGGGTGTPKGTGTPSDSGKPTDTDSKKKGSKKGHHKGGKKSKKSTSDTTATPK